MLDHELGKAILSVTDRPGISQDREDFLAKAKANAGGAQRAAQVEHAIRAVFATLDSCAFMGLHYALVEIEGPAPQEYPKHVYDDEGKFLGQAENGAEEEALRSGVPLVEDVPVDAPPPGPEEFPKHVKNVEGKMLGVANNAEDEQGLLSGSIPAMTDEEVASMNKELSLNA